MSAYNCYGPTETTVEAVVAAIAEHAEPSIGRPTRHTRGYVLDSELRPVPCGATGELYLGGAQLARGYLGRAGRPRPGSSPTRSRPPNGCIEPGTWCAGCPTAHCNTWDAPTPR